MCMKKKKKKEGTAVTEKAVISINLFQKVMNYNDAAARCITKEEELFLRSFIFISRSFYSQNLDVQLDW